MRKNFDVRLLGFDFFGKCQLKRKPGKIDIFLFLVHIRMMFDFSTSFKKRADFKKNSDDKNRQHVANNVSLQ